MIEPATPMANVGKYIQCLDKGRRQTQIASFTATHGKLGPSEATGFIEQGNFSQHRKTNFSRSGHFSYTCTESRIFLFGRVRYPFTKVKSAQVPNPDESGHGGKTGFCALEI